jgi:ubiquinone/menaquinone biosynthesis C-methylase UbiE
MAHVLNKNKAPDLSTLAGRLAHCVEKAGGKRKLAASAILSEAQLFRYLHGLSDIPSERLITIAHAAEVDAGWLLTGAEAGSVIATQAAAQRPPFRPALMQYVARILDEFLVEYQRHFSPRLKSHLLTLIYEALRHDEIVNNAEYLPTKYQMLIMLTLTEVLKTEEQAELYQRAMELLEYDPHGLKQQHQLLLTFCALVKEGRRIYYNSHMGTNYYDRVGLIPLELDVELIHKWMEQAFKHLGKSDLRLLDAGCGNGRYLTFIHQSYPKLKLTGVDIAEEGVKRCHVLEQRNQLPQGTVTQGDCTELALENDSVDLIFSKNVLQYLPYIPGSGEGAEKAWSEMHRVLTPKGLVMLTQPHGTGRTHRDFAQLVTLQDLEALADKYGFKILSHRIDEFLQNADNTVKACAGAFKQKITVILEKR